MSRRFAILVAFLCVSLLASNILETKIFTCGSLLLTGGFLFFPLAYVAGDCLSEVFGYSNARFAIFLAFALNLLFVLLSQLVTIFPPAPFWDGQEHFEYVIKADLRITVASMLAFLVGSLLNAKVLTRMHGRQGEKGFGIRAIVSSLIGESVDSLVFFPLAFWGVSFSDLLKMMIIQVVLKTCYEIAVLPLTSVVVRRLKGKLKEEAGQ